jgi:hypothetical protein
VGEASTSGCSAHVAYLPIGLPARRSVPCILSAGLGSGLFFVGYSLSMIPSQYVLMQVRVGICVFGGGGGVVTSGDFHR